MRAVTVMLPLAALVLTAAAQDGRASRHMFTAGCLHGRTSTTRFTIDGSFYAVVRGERGRFAVGYSGPPVVASSRTSG